MSMCIIVVRRFPSLSGVFRRLTGGTGDVTGTRPVPDDTGRFTCALPDEILSGTLSGDVR